MRIGLIGLAGTGKDTVAGMLQEFTNLPCVAFATPLHDAALHTFGADCLNRENKEREYPFGDKVFERFYAYHIEFVSMLQEWYGIITADNVSKMATIRNIFINADTKRVRETLSPRRLMQLYGTEYWREIAPDIFVYLLRNAYDNAIITDVRFANEAAICDLLIGVKRPNIAAVAGHSSETLAQMLDDMQECESSVIVEFYNRPIPCAVIDNNGTMDELRQKVKRIAENLKT